MNTNTIMLKDAHTAPDKLRSNNTKCCRKIQVPVSDIIRHMTLPPSEAAGKLNISVSTLKRRFWEIQNEGRWPVPEVSHRPRIITKTSKMDLFYVVSKKEQDPFVIDDITLCILRCAFGQT
ncbi:hypothetical protein AKO1_006598, partial [Acrasis kona]